MKRVSAKMFFSVLWRGICQTLGWFFGLFGYKRDGKFAKCVWGMFALSCSVIVTIVAFVCAHQLWKSWYAKYHVEECKNEYCYENRYISRELTLHDHDDGMAYLINKHTGKTVLKGIAWASRPLGAKDSLVVYSDGKKRGYFNMYTGEVVLPPKYSRAWVFSDGIASVEEDGIIKFIDTKGNQVFDRTFTYNPDQDGYVFHGGYCIIDSDDDNKFGLIDTKGKIVIPEEYNDIHVNCQLDHWTLTKGDTICVLDEKLNAVIPAMPCSSIWVSNEENCITVVMLDNTISKYDMQGNLIDDFYITDFNHLEYELEETYQIVQRDYDVDEGGVEYVSSTEHKTARARLCSYTAGNGMDGLMTADGHIVTLPTYQHITAIGPDTYLCTVNNDDKEILNGKGQKIR